MNMQPGSSADRTANGSTAATSFLRIFTSLRPREVHTAALLFFAAFLLYSAYYLVKAAREPLILVFSGADGKAYAAGLQALVLIVVAKLFDLVSRRVSRAVLVGGTIAFFVFQLVAFAIAGTMGLPVAVPFYVWVGVFNLTAITAFWGFANDLYGPERGVRVFPLIAAGSATGAVLGAFLAKIMQIPLGSYGMMWCASAVILCVTIPIFLAHRRGATGAGTTELADSKSGNGAAPLRKDPAFTTLLSDPYFIAIALLVLLANSANTVGEFILDRYLLEAAHHDLGVHASDQALGIYIGRFKADFFLWVNIATILIQYLLVSRVIRLIGVRGALYVLPIIALLGYSAMGLWPVLSVITIAKVAENSIDYSLNITARHSLFLVVSREAKYKVKMICDTIFQRLGDVIAAGIVWIGSAERGAFATPTFLKINLLVQAGWLLVVFWIARSHRRIETNQDGREPNLAVTSV